MKILHCCLANFYIDDFGYQENILPRIHKDQGHEVAIVASTETYIDKIGVGYIQPGSYLSSDGIVVTRLPYASWLPHAFARKLRFYIGLSEQIERFDPDIIFVHDCQFMDIAIIANRAASKGTIIFVDCHTDYINSGRSWLSRHILHGIIYKSCAHKILPWTHRFFGTLPLRVDFLRDEYGIPSSKIELLPFGVDDNRISFENQSDLRHAIRNDLGILPNQLVFISGGKIEARKNIDILINAFIVRSNVRELGDAVLILFGESKASFVNLIKVASEHPNIMVLGWLPALDIYKYLWASDVAVFPGTHSVLWEEAVGLGVPCIFKRWPGIGHVDLGGNCIMLDDIDETHLGDTLAKLASEPDRITTMKKIASTHGREFFSYSQIARRALCTE